MLGTVASLRSFSRVVFTDARPFGARALQRPRPFRKATGLFTSICWLGKMTDYRGREGEKLFITPPGQGREIQESFLSFSNVFKR